MPPDPSREPLFKAMADRPSEATREANEVMRRVLADPDYGKPPPAALTQAQRDAARASRPAAAPQSAQAREAAQMEAQQSRALVR